MKNDALLNDFFAEVQNFKQNETPYTTEFLQIGTILLYEEYKTYPDRFSFTADQISYTNGEQEFALSKERFLSVTGKKKEELSALFVNPDNSIETEENIEESQMSDIEKEQALEIRRLREELAKQKTEQSKPNEQSKEPNPSVLITKEIEEENLKEDDFSNVSIPDSAELIEHSIASSSNDDFASDPDEEDDFKEDVKEIEVTSVKPNVSQKKKESQNTLETWICPKCGSKNTGKFCQDCGEKKQEIIKSTESVSTHKKGSLFDMFDDVPKKQEKNSALLSETSKATVSNIATDENQFKKPKSTFLFNEHIVTFVRKENGFEQNGKLYVFPLDGRKDEELGSRIFAVLDMNGLLRHGTSKEGRTSVMLEYNHSDFVVRGSFKEGNFRSNIGTISKNIKEIRQKITNYTGNGKTPCPVISIEGKEYYVFPHGVTNNKTTGLAAITMLNKESGKVHLCDDMQNICIEGKEKMINITGYWTKDFFCIDLK